MGSRAGIVLVLVILIVLVPLLFSASSLYVARIERRLRARQRFLIRRVPKWRPCWIRRGRPSIATMFSRGIPGLPQPPTERASGPCSLLAPFSSTCERGLADLRHGVPRTPTSRGLTLPMRTDAVAHARLHVGNVGLLAPVEHVEAGVGQVLKAGLDRGVVVVELHPVLREGVADPLQVGMAELPGNDPRSRSPRCRRGGRCPRRSGPWPSLMRLEPVDDSAACRDRGACAPTPGFSTRSIMKSLVLRAKPAVHIGPREVAIVEDLARIEHLAGAACAGGGA